MLHSFQNSVPSGMTTTVPAPFSVHQNHLEDLLKHRLLGPTSPVSDSVGRGAGLRICNPSKFPGGGYESRTMF